MGLCGLLAVQLLYKIQPHLFSCLIFIFIHFVTPTSPGRDFSQPQIYWRRFLKMASPASASRGEAQRAEQARSQSQTATVGNTDRLCRPGFGLPLTWMPRANGLYGYSRTPLHFPVLFRPRDPQGYLGDPTGWAAATLLIREVCMLKLIDDLTNKPEWWHKIYDPSICAKWKSEAMAMDWKLYRPHADFTPNMVDAVRQASLNVVLINLQDFCI